MESCVFVWTVFLHTLRQPFINFNLKLGSCYSAFLGVFLENYTKIVLAAAGLNELLMKGYLRLCKM